jgi:hypothetical protein
LRDSECISNGHAHAPQAQDIWGMHAVSRFVLRVCLKLDCRLLWMRSASSCKRLRMSVGQMKKECDVVRLLDVDGHTYLVIFIRF